MQSVSAVPLQLVKRKRTGAPESTPATTSSAVRRPRRHPHPGARGDAGAVYRVPPQTGVREP